MSETTRPIIRIHNVEANEIIDREMDDAEFTAYQENLAKVEAEKAAKGEAEAKRQALLDKLGITEEEAKLLLS